MRKNKVVLELSGFSCKPQDAGKAAVLGLLGTGSLDPLRWALEAVPRILELDLTVPWRLLESPE